MNARALFLCIVAGSIPRCAAAIETEPGTGSSVFLGTTPTTPIAGQPFQIDLFNGPCESLLVQPEHLTLQSVVGNTLTLNLRGLPDEACSQPEATVHVAFAGIAVPGIYRVRIEMVTDVPGLQGEFLGGRDVVVVAPAGGRATQAIPALGVGGSLSGLALLLLLAARSLRGR